MDAFRSWWSQPFSEGMSVTRWFLFFGLLIAISVAWGIILRHIVSNRD